MKTHVNDFSYSGSTSKGIEKSGLESLSRALSMRRMIAFTASGTTMEYGRPAWVDLVNKYIFLAEKNYDRLKKRCDKQQPMEQRQVIISHEYDDIWEEFVLLFKRIKYNTADQSQTNPSAENALLSRLKALDDARHESRDYWDIPKSLRSRPDFVKTFLSICEDLATYVIEGDDKNRQGQLRDVRKVIARQFAKVDLVEFYQATMDSVGRKKEAEPGQAATIEEIKEIEKSLKKQYTAYYERQSYDSSKIVRVNSDARIAILCHTLEMLCKQGVQSQNCFDYQDLLGPMFKQGLDPLSIIYKDLEIRRFLTLNFDIEIERMLATHYANHNDEKHQPFLNFLQKPVDDKTPIKSKHDLDNGLQQAVRSATIGESNLGDLFTFGAFPANFDSLVFHLHGRVDDPENMVITQLDYERLYLNSTNLQRSFEEARHAVFNGSDILFVGTGLNESDVIAPLRDFTARHRQMDDVTGQVYALLPSSTSKRYRGENIGLAQTLYKNYGVYSIFFDGADSQSHKQLRKDRYYLEYLVDVFNDSKSEQSVKSEQPVSEDGYRRIEGDQLTGFVKRIKKHQWHNPEPENQESLKGREIYVAYRLINDVSGGALENAEWSDQTLLRLDGFDLSLEKCRLLRQVILALLSRIRSRALQQGLQELTQQRIDWWKRWKSRPGHRVAYYGKMTSPEASDGKPLLWVRQQANYYYPPEALNDYFQGEGETYSYHYMTALSAVKASADEAPVRIKRVVAPKGAGKGGMVRFLSQAFQVSGAKDKRNYYPFEYVFHAEDGQRKNQPLEYQGGFFAHLTFTLEFTSTIFALVRFIAKAARLEERCKYLTPEAINSDKPDRSTGLRLLNIALSELRKSEHRVFICLSGIYRLVDEQGDAYSPVHREFFRILTKRHAVKDEAVDYKDKNTKRFKKSSVDLLLVALGQKYPIRYLSEEVKGDKKHEIPASILNQSHLYDYREDRKVWLKRWDKLPMAGIDQLTALAVYSAQESFRHVLKDVSRQSDLSHLVQEHLSQKRGGTDWGDLIDFIQKRVVYVHIVVRLVYWYDLVHSRDENAGQFTQGLENILGRLAITIGQGTEQDLMRQLLVEYQRLDHEYLMMEELPECPLLVESAYKLRVDVFDAIIRHLALFNYPVQPCVLLACPDLRYRLDHLDTDIPDTMVPSKDDIIRHALAILVARGLVVRVEPCCSDDHPDSFPPQKEQRCRYILHRDAAEVVTRDMNYISQNSISAAPYQSTFYCAQVQARRGIPSVEHFNFVSSLLENCLSLNHEFTGRYQKDEIIAPALTSDEALDGFYRASAIIRGAYAILRGSFSVGAVSRLCRSGNFHNKQPYQAYRSWLQDIINSAVGLSEYRQALLERQFGGENQAAPESFLMEYNQPFYRDEVAWLYNEYAVVSFMQGRLFDAKTLYNQAIRVLIAHEGDDEDQSIGAPRRRIQINLALTEIELGNIRDASILLDKVIAEVVIRPHSTLSVTMVYAKGYRALCDHLTGNFTQAEKGYRRAIKKVLKMRQLRAASIFKRHLADLLRVQGRSEEATKYLLLSEKTATQSQQEDILHYTLIARARLMRDMESRSEALQILRQTEDYAKAMGLQKMLAETLKVRAEVMLAEGEVTQAGKMAAQAVAISKRNGMRLRKISAALLQAKVCAQRKQMDFAKQILDEIDHEASELGYTLKSGDAQKFRQSML